MESYGSPRGLIHTLSCLQVKFYNLKMEILLKTNFIKREHSVLSFFIVLFLKNIYLILTVLGLHCCRGFSLVAVIGGYSLSAVTQGSYWSGFSCCRVWALGHAGGLSICGSRALEHSLNSCGAWAELAQGIVESSQTRDRTCGPCTGRDS